jgi:hypothetical protein
MSITEIDLQALPFGNEVKVCRINPHGSLYARKDAVGSVGFTWRWTYLGAQDREKVGLWDPAADPRKIEPTATGWTVKAAIRMAEEWALEHDRTLDVGGFRASRKEAEKNEKLVQLELSHFSLGQLMEDYAKLLKSRGQNGSARDVRYAVNKHIRLAHNKIYCMPAVQVGREELIAILRKINETGHKPLSGKIRSYIHTAYQVALTAASESNTPPEFQAYKIVANPVSQIGVPQPLKNGEIRDDENTLNLGEMRIYWDIIRKLPGQQGAALRLHLLVGGARTAQLVRLKTEDIRSSPIPYIVLYDLKGRGHEVRIHAIPLTGLARQALADCAPRGEYALSTGDGTLHVAAQTMTNWAKDAVGNAIPDFQLKRVRSGVETLLSDWQVPEKTRGRLQSHGLSGVQDRHYVRSKHFYAVLEALEILEAVLLGRLKEPPRHLLLDRLWAEQLQQAA